MRSPLAVCNSNIHFSMIKSQDARREMGSPFDRCSPATLKSTPHESGVKSFPDSFSLSRSSGLALTGGV